MGFKRKRSLTTIISSSPTSTSLLADQHPHLSLFTSQLTSSTKDPNNQLDFNTYSPPEPYFSQGLTQSSPFSSPLPHLQDIDIIPQHLNSRTRKRLRNNREDDETINRRTVELLFQGARRELSNKSHKEDSLEMDSGYTSSENVSTSPNHHDLTTHIFDDDETMADGNDNIMVDPSSTERDDRLHQTALNFPVLHQQQQPHEQQSRFTSVGNDYGVPIQQGLGQAHQLKKEKEQKSLHAFFGGGGAIKKADLVPPHHQHDPSQEFQMPLDNIDVAMDLDVDIDHGNPFPPSSSFSSTPAGYEGYRYLNDGSDHEGRENGSMSGRKWVGGIGWI